ncbi:hypothetical protein FA15DRAFT_670684 [Coprinopsis marcescibilis]|uniref:Uncharacterized protein n=1 Tax=Coprinopsis marcescibilis TaxID=230819 RepID=A0A5C3KRW5_COPMA|nr:hypothetical protein FA15DRAFT_670684 [Coprinopsis marcescibilis]
MATPRYLSFDDDHPGIQYEGDWEVDLEQYSNLNTLGYHGGGQHRTSGTASLSFSFQGSVISLFGTNRSLNSTTDGLDWECIVDGQVYPSPTTRIVQNNFPYCSIASLNPNEMHTFTMNIEATEETPLWVDMMNVYPSANTAYHATLSNYSTQLDVNDTSIRYGPDWEYDPGGSYAKFTKSPNSFLEMEFIGTHLVWRGMALSGQSPAQSRATYSVDGGPPINFTIYGPRSNTGQYTLFETERLPRNRHQLKVVYEGFEAPLALNLLWIEDGDIFNRDPRTLGTTLDGLRVDPLERPAAPETQTRSQIGPIVGGIVGGVLFLLLLVAALWIFLRRKRRTESLDGDVSYLGAQPLGAVLASTYGAQAYTRIPLDPDTHGLTPFTTQHYTGMSAAPSNSLAPYPTYSKSAASGTREPAPFAPHHHTGTSASSSGPSTASYSGSAVATAPGTFISPKAQLASTRPPEANPVFYQDSGVRFNTLEADAVPPAYTPG